MKCSVYIATSADGFIATPDGSVDWLMAVANTQEPVEMAVSFESYLKTVDCLIMGRKCMEQIASFNLSAEQWPYGDLRIIVLSKSISEVPDSLPGKVEMYAGEIPDLIAKLEAEGYQHAYVDGGSVITSFLNLQLINEMTVSQAPIILGDGLRLFGKVDKAIKLQDVKSEAYENGFIQSHYSLQYSA